MSGSHSIHELVPSLRFPGFAEEWSSRSLSEVAEFRNGKAHEQEISEDGEFVVVNSKFISTEGRVRKHSNANLSPLASGDIALVMSDIPKGGALAKCYFVEHDDVFTLNQRICAISATHCHGRFLFYRINRNRYFLEFDSGVGQTNLRKDEVLSCPVTCPPNLDEQRKIADFLTAVDGRIQQLSQKLALLQDYKKGVMQQLFTQALRFKDDHGNDFPDWEEKKYENVYTFQNTNSFSRDLLTYDGGEVRNIHYGDIHTKFRSNFYLTKEKVPFIKPDVDISRISDGCYCRHGDLVIADASEDYGDVGKCIEIMDLAGQRTLAGLHTFIARPKKGIMASGFGGYLMQCREMRLKIMTVAQGTKVLGVSKTQLSQLMLPIPSLPEQTKIANFLTALDRKIESVAHQITHTQAFKRGLLQQMFV